MNSFIKKKNRPTESNYLWWFGMTDDPFCCGFPLIGNGLAVLKQMPRLWLQLLCGIGGGCPGGGGKNSAQLVGTEMKIRKIVS